MLLPDLRGTVSTKNKGQGESKRGPLPTGAHLQARGQKQLRAARCASPPVPPPLPGLPEPSQGVKHTGKVFCV